MARRRASGVAPLKVILMSATLDAEAFGDYFGGCPGRGAIQAGSLYSEHVRKCAELAFWGFRQSDELNGCRTRFGVFYTV